jgi:hypothetical protein
MTIKTDWKLNVPSFAMTALASAAGCVVAFVVLQSDVKALNGHVLRVEQRVERIEARREADREESRIQRNADREAVLTMQGDIRVVRQILEGMRTSPSGPR